jgi:hypothetical protein
MQNPFMWRDTVHLRVSLSLSLTFFLPSSYFSLPAFLKEIRWRTTCRWRFTRRHHRLKATGFMAICRSMIVGGFAIWMSDDGRSICRNTSYFRVNWVAMIFSGMDFALAEWPFHCNFFGDGGLVEIVWFSSK